jgi:hypothetical protein
MPAATHAGGTRFVTPEGHPMISDSLAEASWQINDYLDAMPHVYSGTLRLEVERVLHCMDKLRQRLDDPTYDWSALDALTLVKQQVSDNSDWYRELTARIIDTADGRAAAEILNDEGAVVCATN